MFEPVAPFNDGKDCAGRNSCRGYQGQSIEDENGGDTLLAAWPSDPA
jgi:hypothetical protein